MLWWGCAGGLGDVKEYFFLCSLQASHWPISFFGPIPSYISGICLRNREVQAKEEEIPGANPAIRI